MPELKHEIAFEVVKVTTLAQASVTPQASDFFRSVHNSHLYLHSIVA